MSTRCQIAFYERVRQKYTNPDAIIYKHCDGYPSGILPTVIAFLIDFKNHRGTIEPEYASAWLLYEFMRMHRSYCRKAKTMKYSKYIDSGICKRFHGDIRYLYCIYPDRVEVREPFNDCSIIGTINISDMKLGDFTFETKTMKIKKLRS